MISLFRSLTFRNEGTCKELFERFWPQREVLPGGGGHHGVPPHLVGEPPEAPLDGEHT
jgi:hypothetical protein